MVRIFIGFVGGVVYGAIVTAEVPDGLIAKAAVILRIIFFGGE